MYEAVAFLEYLGLSADSINNCGSQATTAGLREYNPDEEEEETVTAKLYPNPASDHININLDRADSGEYYIYNSIGQLVKNGICTPTDKISLTDINPGGLYYIQLVEENGNAETLSFYIEK